MALRFHPLVRTFKQKLVVSVFTVLGPLILAGSTFDQVRHQKLMSTGVKTQARVVNAHLEHASRGADRYRLDIRFKPVSAPKTEQSGTLYLSTGQYDPELDGPSLPVVYSKADPSQVEWAGGSDAYLGILMGGVMVVIGALGLVLPSMKKGS